MSEETLGLLVFLYQVAVNLSFFACLGYLILRTYHIATDNQWDGYDTEGIKRIVDQFALSPPDVRILLSMIRQPYGAAMPIAGCYEPENTTIIIDTRIVRSERALIKTLLHEIAHHNQHVTGRIYLGMEGFYVFRPVEREARNFASVWRRLGRRIYRNK